MAIYTQEIPKVTGKDAERFLARIASSEERKRRALERKYLQDIDTYGEYEARILNNKFS
ncbi:MULTISPECIES: hypothetical protein [Listeria]|uniref:hypothetical protein n=1 Tax=Listeria TaxID=1637 RepID=UPI000669BBD1|nr:MULTISPECIES: hypothetical protein [Listeria]KMT63438.1 hypothetical protein X559_0206 [Listeria newyorkensis]